MKNQYRLIEKISHGQYVATFTFYAMHNVNLLKDQTWEVYGICDESSDKQMPYILKNVLPN